MHIDHENLFRDALATGVNLFLGAGFSTLAKDVEGNALPTGSQLASELVKEFGLTTAATLTLPQICTIIEHTRRADLRAFLKRRFSVSSFDSTYCNLQRVNIETIFTTNIDDLLFKVYEASVTHYLNDLDIRGAAYNDRTAIDLVTLCGCVLDESRHYTFSTIDVASAFRADPDRWHLLTGRMQQKPTLFWGYSLSDGPTLEAVSPLTIRGRNFKERWIALLPDTDGGTIDYFRALKFHILLTDTSSLLNFIASLAARPIVDAISLRERSTAELFPEYAIPDVSRVPVRPLVEFFLGAPPSWYDVFSGQIPRTQHLARIRDSVHSTRHTLVIGAPATGKTTLLMQAAHELNFKGHKLVCEAPSPEKAVLICKRLEGSRALILVDNFADSVDAFAHFSGQTNVVLVGADRDFNFEIVSHRLDVGRFNVLDVTGLSDADLQLVLSAIPEAVRSPFAKEPGLAAGLPVSLFEVIESNLAKATLGNRFLEALRQLQAADQRLADFLLVACYVHSCRTPVSMDMLLAFFRDEVADFREIYAMRDRIGATLSEYLGALDDAVQDYYTPRSTIAAEAVMDRAPAEFIKRVVCRFHSEVSPYRIHRFDVFRRRAYDAALMRRIFSDWNEGQSFYEQAYARDRSPYVLQQGALYLANKRQFTAAFAWIDDANRQSEGRIPSIRNSHAVILFRANIEAQETDGTVRRTLDRSMDMLAECYRYDKRKAYHAITLGDQALRYWDRYGDTTACDYLEIAAEWLTTEEKRSPWNRNVKRLRTLVENKLARLTEA